MRKFSFASPAGLVTAILAAGLIAWPIAAAHAQNSTARPAEPGKTPAKQDPAKPQPNDDFLARAGKLYYSAARSGMRGFDCAVHPDWHGLFASASKGVAVADNDPRIVLLKAVNIKLHGRLTGGSTLEWNQAANPTPPVDADSAAMLDSMHSATSQTLEGFMQFWTPFVDGSVIPANAEGLEITQTENGRRIHIDEGGTSVTELFDSSLILQHFDVVTGGMTVNFAPSYRPTEKGLLVSGFRAHIQPPGVAREQATEMHVEIEYQTLGGSPIPARINADVANSGTFNFVLDGCTVNP
jgi:hypothetical protein